MNQGFGSLTERPPHGLTPRFIWDEQRRDDLKAAINRYISANKQVPPEWIEEYNEVIVRLSK